MGARSVALAARENGRKISSSFLCCKCPRSKSSTRPRMWNSSAKKPPTEIGLFQRRTKLEARSREKLPAAGVLLEHRLLFTRRGASVACETKLLHTNPNPLGYAGRGLPDPNLRLLPFLRKEHMALLRNMSPLQRSRSWGEAFTVFSLLARFFYSVLAMGVSHPQRFRCGGESTTVYSVIALRIMLTPTCTPAAVGSAP